MRKLEIALDDEFAQKNEGESAMPGDETTSGLFTRSEDIPDERFRFFCSECGEEIHGVPYKTTWHGWCACFDPWDFCSEECWNKNDLLNSANWPPNTRKW